MMISVKNIEWDNFKVSVPSFLTLALMPFTYNISYGIAFGLISYIIISIFCCCWSLRRRRVEELSWLK